MCTVTLEVLEQSLIGIHPQIPYKSLLLFLSRITIIEQLQQASKAAGHLAIALFLTLTLHFCVLNKVN